MKSTVHQTLQGEIAYLQSKIDFLESELSYINHLLVEFGFAEGTESLKAALEEMIEEGSSE